MPSGRAPPPASVNALARAKAKAASEISNERKRTGNPLVRNRAGLGEPEDDPDRLYFSRGLGALDSDSESGDSDSAGVGDGDDWGEDEVFFTDDWDHNGGDHNGGDEQRDRVVPVFSPSYQPPAVSYDLNPPGYVSPDDSASDTEEEGGQEVGARFEWQHMLTNVLEGDVFKSEKTRLSTASLATTTLAKGFEYVGEGKTGKRQRAYAIWLLVRAKVRGTSPEEESRYIVEARAKVDDVLQEVLKFRVAEPVRGPDDLPIDDDARAKNAEDQVAGLLQRVDWCETLYPSTKALALEKERVQDLDLVTRLEALRSWHAITRRLAVTIGILKKWTGEDWETLSSISIDQAAAPVQLAFVAGIVREDTLQVTFQKRLLLDLHSIVNVAKSAMSDLGPEFESMNLPGFSSDLLRLALFPSRLVQEVLRHRLDSVTNIHDPSVVLIDQLTDGLRMSLWTACEIKKQYVDVAEHDPVSGWQLPARVEEYDETLLAALRFFFKLLHWKLKSPSRAIYFKETEIVESEWGFLSGVTEQIDGGDLLVGEHFSTLTHRLLLRVLGYFETQLQVLETRDMTLQDMLRWFSQTLDNVRARHRKLLRFGKTMLQRFENSAEYKLENIDLATFLNGLVETEHFIIYTGTFEREGIYVIGDPSLHERPDLVRHILARCFSRNTQYDSPSRPSELPRPGPPEARAAEYFDPDDHMHYVLLLSPREPFMWTGRVMNLELPKMEFDLRDRRVRIVADGPGFRLARSKQIFTDLFPAFRRNVLIEQKAHLARVSREIKKIGRAVFRLAEVILTSVERIKAVSLRTPGQGQELVGSYFAFAADLGQRSIKYLEPSVRTRYVLMLMKFSISWIAFICDDCVPTDPRTFKWAVSALEFAMFITRGENILKFSSDEFALLRSKVASCMTLLISHFDILGARSSHEAKKEQERIDAARLETKRKLALKLRALRVTGHYTADGDGGDSEPAPPDDQWQEGGSLSQAWRRRMDALQVIEDRRTAIESSNRTVGKVMDQDTAGDRGLAFLASSSSNISIRWQQGKFIGGGTFGQVYLAVNLDSGEELAVKEIRFQDLTSAPHLIKTIRDEMKVMEMLRHPNIVEYYGIEVHRDKVYIFEEYCAGGSLANLLEHGRIEDEILIQIYAAQMLDGLEYLHKENVVHRDIKPDNILLDGNGTIKFVDFGAAKVLAKNSKTLAGRSRIAVDGGADANSLTGTPMYLSPETVKGERRGKKGAMDVWSLGCVILECATGRRPWSNLDNEWAIMFHIGIAVQHPPLPDPSQLSELGIDFIRQCLTIDPVKRPTAVELLSHPWIEQAREELAGAWEVESQAGMSSIGSTNGSWGTVDLGGVSSGVSSSGLGGPVAVLEEEEEEPECSEGGDRVAEPPRADLMVAQPRRREVHLSPTSNSWRLSTDHLSAALSYHLTQIHLSGARKTSYHGVLQANPLERKYGSVVRLGDLENVEELAVQVFMLRGTRYSKHSALIGNHPQADHRGFSGPMNDDDVEIGLTRRRVQETLLKKLASLVMRVPLADVTPAATMERLVLARVALGLTQIDPEEHHRLAGVILRQGMLLLDRPGCGEREQADIRRYLSDVARDELVGSLILKTASAVSRKTFTRIFPSYAQLPPFPPLSPRDLDLIHSADASTSQAYDALKTTLNVPILTLLDEVIRIVSYHAASDRFAALKKAWSLLDDVLEHVEITLRSVAVGDVSRSSARRADFVGYIFVLRMVGVNLLWGCDLLLEDLKGVGRETAVALRRSSQAKLDDALVRLASHAFVLMSLESGAPRKDMSFAMRLVTVLNTFRGLFLDRWCHQYPEDAQIFQRMVLVAAWGSPEASRLALELRKVIPPASVSLPETTLDPAWIVGATLAALESE